MPENLEYIYTSFPDKKIRRENIEIGGKTAKELECELNLAKIDISGVAEFMLRSHDFITNKNVESVTLICLTVADLGFIGKATIDKIYQRAEELGLELCPVEVGPHYRLQYQNQPRNECIRVGMKLISDSGGSPRVFSLGCDSDGLWLDPPGYAEQRVGVRTMSLCSVSARLPARQAGLKLKILVPLIL